MQDNNPNDVYQNYNFLPNPPKAVEVKAAKKYNPLPSNFPNKKDDLSWETYLCHWGTKNLTNNMSANLWELQK